MVTFPVFHEEKPVEQFGGEKILLVEYHAEVVHIRGFTTLGLGESEHCDDVEFLRLAYISQTSVISRCSPRS